jgi:hypothetical protein
MTIDSERSEMADEIMPQVEETKRYGQRGVQITNAYASKYADAIGYYDRDRYEAWQEDRTAENAEGLPYEVTRDDRGKDISWSEAETRHLLARLTEIVAGWDAKKR